jgi:hypothetical protein
MAIAAYLIVFAQPDLAPIVLLLPLDTTPKASLGNLESDSYYDVVTGEIPEPGASNEDLEADDDARVELQKKY